MTVFFWTTSDLCYYLSNFNIVGFVVKWWALALVSCDPALGSAVNTRHTCSGITWKMVNKCPEKCWILWRWVGRSGSNPRGVLGLPRGQGCWPSSCKCNIFEYGRNTSQIIIRRDKFCLLTSLIGVLCCASERQTGNGWGNTNNGNMSLSGDLSDAWQRLAARLLMTCSSNCRIK